MADYGYNTSFENVTDYSNKLHPAKIYRSVTTKDSITFQAIFFQSLIANTEV